MKKISIIGSTGSIGTQALDVIKNSNGEYNVVGLTANENIDLLEKQIYDFRPKVVGVYNKNKATELRNRLVNNDIKVVSGMDGLIEVATQDETDIVLTSVVGMIGLKPTLASIKSGKTIALANKETLVTAGELVMDLAAKNNVNILPVDSEHSAIFQCLKGGKKEEVSKIILTASGGPFRGKKIHELTKVTFREALKHPNWSMGRKISIDSATLMNKGLELIEAKWLFDMDINDIDVIVHPQSIIHSMVEYIDGSVIAQMGIPDMRIPIQYALTYPSRSINPLKKLDIINVGTLTFEAPDEKSFPCLQLAIDAIKKGGTMPTVLNAVNEIAVDLFLKEKISFVDISILIEKIMSKHKRIIKPNLDEIIDCDKWAREEAISELNI